jgi:hypothetical protein
MHTDIRLSGGWLFPIIGSKESKEKLPSASPFKGRMRQSNQNGERRVGE